MIRKILIEGVRTHERTEIVLGRLTCLVGPNGSGKTTVLESFQSLMHYQPVSWLRPGTGQWIVEVADERGREARTGADGRINLTRGQEILAVFSFRLDSERLRAASEHKEPKLASNGAGLAQLLAHWKLSEEEKFQIVLNQLQLVVPALKNIRPISTQIDGRPVFELYFDFHSASRIPAQAVSEGTLLSLGLLTALHELGPARDPEASVIVLLDDIDRGLHPDAQVELIKLLRKLAEIKDFQIVMTTHSPYIVDALSPDEVCVLALDESGTTRARMLSAIPGAEKYRGMLSTGELWSSHGESWVLDEQAKSKSA